MLSYRFINETTLQNMLENEIADKCCWHFHNVCNSFIVFSDNGTDIGLVEYKANNNDIFLEMIEVFRPFRGQSYGEKMIKLLQNNFSALRCVPIEKSESLFIRLGFKAEESCPQIWFWNK